MLKINLSDSDSRKKETGVEGDFVPSSEETPVNPPPSKGNKKKRESSAPQKPNKVLLVILLAVLFTALCYLERNLIQKYLPDISKFTKKTPQVVVPEPVKSQPEEIAESEVNLDSVSTHFDPLFGLLEEIYVVMPPKTWISSLEMSYDGSFSLNAMSFDYKAIADFIKAIDELAEITSKKIPPVSKSAEAVYNFSLSGKITYSDIPDILDTVSPDSLAAYSFPAALSSKNTGVRLTSLPKTGVTYKDNEMPFVMDGEIGAIEKVIAGMFAGRNNLRIYKFSLQGLPGTPYDRVRASFSVRSVPTL